MQKPFLQDEEDFIKVAEKHLKYENSELILLKGHLILEQLINDNLLVFIKDEKSLDKLRLSFDKKLDLLNALDDGGFMEEVISHLKQLNRIRNKLAHHLNFDLHREDLKKWACDVLNNTPKTINKNKTYCNTVRKAISYLAGYLSAILHVKDSLQIKSTFSELPSKIA